MRRDSMKRGSALLVVLGMLAFMMFSGLAYSVYMRATRLPSSFLRRTAASRQLAKAALAEAMEDIDSSIGNYLHPNIGGRSTASSGTTKTTTSYANQWRGRVFLGNTDELVADVETVPTLTLEALAYLPPCLINEVRYYSRRVPSARWQGFFFDSGRYAYTAVDVSDFFDLNRVTADLPRSSAPNGRISFAHLFETGEGGNKHSSKGTMSNAKVFDDLKTSAQSSGLPNDMPYVSLADFNLAWGDQTLFGVQNPFYKFVKDGVPYMGSESDSNPYLETYRGLTFVTDNWFPTPEENKTEEDNLDIYDLASEQPFSSSLLTSSSIPSLFNVTTSDPLARNVGKRLSDRFMPAISFAALYDYLDEDSVPVSLAIPTTERVPMVCGLQPSMNGVTLEITKNETSQELNPAGTHPNTKEIRREYKLNVNGLPSATALFAYPFLQRGDDTDDSFKIDGRIALFFTDTNTKTPFRVGTYDGLYMKNDGDFSATGLQNDSIFTWKINQQSLTAKPSTTVDPKNGSVIQQKNLTPSASSPGAKTIVTLIYQIQEVQDAASGAWSYPTTVQDTDLQRAENGEIALVNVDGTNVRKDEQLLKNMNGLSAADLQGTTWHRDLALHAAVWIRVKNSDGKTVDLAPACMRDDKLNGTDNYMLFGPTANQIGGRAYPILRFDANLSASLTVSPNGLETLNGQSLTVTDFAQEALLVVDPRFNHAPENWYPLTGVGTISQDTWVDEAKQVYTAANHDGDPFMATSDQAYMQSIYELAFLPRLTYGLTPADRGNEFYGKMPSLDVTWTDYEGRGSTLHNDFMFRSYSPVEDAFDSLGIVSGETGLRVCPYSDSTNVLMAAFANTPADWRLASTNENTNAHTEDDAASFNSKYAWNAYGASETRISWELLEDIAGNLMTACRADNGTDFEDAFANMWGNNWLLDEDSLAGVTDLDSYTDVADISSVDKRFFYGYWHDAFMSKSRQQLFLIFLRAEPMMMGGGVEGSAPPQMGAHAVALVWRDPTQTAAGSSSGSSSSSSSSTASGPSPHRMRVLFYHQFD